MDIVGNFSLPGDFVDRIMVSIEEATERVLSPDSIEGQFEYLEIAVLAPVRQASKVHTWGFFRLEKTSTDTEMEGTKGYCVEYYLYLDKKNGK